MVLNYLILMKMHKIILPIVTVLTVVSCTQPRLCGSNVDRILGQLTTDEKLHLLVGASGLSGEVMANGVGRSSQFLKRDQAIQSQVSNYLVSRPQEKAIFMTVLTSVPYHMADKIF